MAEQFEIVTATMSDLEDIVELESLINPSYRVGRNGVVMRLQQGGGVYVMQVKDTIAGVLFSVRANSEREDHFTYDSMHEFVDGSADTCYWIHIIVHPDYRSLSSNFHIHARRMFFNDGVKRIRALTHCSAFSGNADLIATYAHDNQKVDKNLFFHSARGGLFKRVLRNYNASDVANSGCAIVMEYLDTQQSTTQEASRLRLSKKELTQLVKDTLPELDSFDALQPWFEMGMDSFTLMKFHADIEQACQEKLDVSFLFGVNNFSKLEKYFSKEHDRFDGDEEESHVPGRDEPLGIYGIGFRFPNRLGEKDLDTCEELWKCFDEVEDDQQVNCDDFKKLTNLGRFDVKSFEGLVSREQAKYIPPMQRWIMECVTVALADSPTDLLASTNHNIGVFVGAWENAGVLGHDASDIERSTNGISAFSNSILANRISFLFDLKGPSIVVDTACSSSLVALDCARSSILLGHCKAAIVIGCNQVLASRTELLSSAGFLSSDKRCFPFDSRANGYARSEGCGALVIAPESFTTESPRALLRSTAVNQDGATVNLHAPNPDAQIALFKKACQIANVDPSKLCFVEAHGTGTKLGDPIEAYTMSQVFCKERTQPNLWISTSKAKFGHMEGAAGILGLIKVTLSLQMRQLPRNSRLVDLNAKIPFDEYRISPVGKETIKLAPQGILWGGISSFGFGGTNSHAILSSSERDRGSLKEKHCTNWEMKCEHIPFQPYRPVWQAKGKISLGDARGFLAQHRLGTMSVAPATFLMSSVASLLGNDTKTEPLSFGNVRFQKMVTPSDEFLELNMNQYDAVSLMVDGVSACATMSKVESKSMPTMQSSKECHFELITNTSSFYASLGNKYSGHFNGILNAMTNQDGSHIVSHLRMQKHENPMLVSTALFDVALHAILALYEKSVRTNPTYVDTIDLVTFAPNCFLRVQQVQNREFTCDIEANGEDKWNVHVFVPNSECIFSIEGIKFGFFKGDNKQLLFKDEWIPASLEKDESIIWKYIDVPTCKELHEKMKSVPQVPTRVMVRDPGQASYLRTFRCEYPQSRVQSIWGTIDTSTNLAHERELRFGDSVCTRRLVPASSTSGHSVIRISTRSVVVVTGGIGAVGARVVRKLHELGADQVLVLGRNPPTASIHPSTLFVKCDVGNQAEVQNALNPYLGSITGIFHCAGTLSDSIIPNLKPEDFDTAYYAKVEGARNLLSLNLPELEFCILFSSVTSAFGSASQANYAAANGYLDELARTRTQLNNEKVLSVQFGPWAEGGMASNASHEGRWIRMGLPLLDPDLAIQTLFNISDDCLPVVMLAQMLASNLDVADPYVEKLCNTVQRDASESDDALSVIQELLQTFNLEVEADQPWREAGMDSLSMVELRNMLLSRFQGIKMSDTLLFDYATPQSLADWISSKSNDIEDEVIIIRKQEDGTSHAIVGAACTLPGNISTPEEFFEFLSQGRDAITEIPMGRFDFSDHFDEKKGSLNKMYTKHGAFINHMESFNHMKYGISLEEALNMDPQQRIAIEMAHEALEDAQMLKSKLRIGVFVGCMTNDWSHLPKGTPNAYTASGHCVSIIANRVSYVLGLNGPSMTIDTACSSSLVAMDAACGAIDRGDCDAAVVIGVNLILSSDMYVQECAARMLSADGHCFTFSKKANGYARGEGCVALVVMPETKAKGEMIWGLILGVAVNQDGRSANLTSPNGPAQQDVVRRALAKANKTVADISYIETHGTGTGLGDPLEVGALAQVFKTCTQSIGLGAVKSSVGHGEGAAGVTSLLKVLTCFQHGYVPGNISLTTLDDLNPKLVDVALPSMDFLIKSSRYELHPENIAGVSGFGFGGTNCHVVLGSSGVNHVRKSIASRRMNYPVVPIPVMSPDLIFELQWVKAETEPDIVVSSNIFEVRFVEDVMEIIRDIDAAKAVNLCFVTRESVFKVNNEAKIPTAAVSGFIKSLRLEFPKWNIAHLDVYDRMVVSRSVRLFHLNYDLAIRLDQNIEVHMVPELHRWSKGPVFLTALQGSIDISTILISGASGGIAQTIIQYFKDNLGPCRFICIGRSGRKAGCVEGVKWYKCDVAAADSVKQLKKDLEAAGIEVTCILHTAGVLEESPVKSCSANWLGDHMNVKIKGAQNLEDAFPDVSSFVTFSSTSALFGMSNGAAYAAANSALNAFAECRATKGLPVTNVMWDMWNEAGMASDRGMTSTARGLSTSHACQSLIGLMKQQHAEVAVIKTQWGALNTGHLKFLVGNLVNETSVASSSTEVKKSVSMDSKQLMRWILEQVANFTEFTVTDGEMPWREMGFDSLSMVAFVTKVNDHFGLDDEVSDTSMFDYPTPTSFLHFLLKLIEEQDPSTVSNTSPQLNSTSNEVAIVSMALRFPGPRSNCDVQGFWNFLCSDGDAMREIPGSRFKIPEAFQEEIYVQTGGFLHPDLFYAPMDSKQFHMSQAEMSSTDPHQLIALQVAFEALENAEKVGAPLDNVGVFVGAQNTEFGAAQQLAKADVNAYSATGTSLSIIANRISYSFNLNGPSMTVDTACSSSITALNLAILSLKSGDCTTALVMGIDLMLSPHRFHITCGAKMLSPNGRCATFSDGADGYARGEGCGAIVITLDNVKAFATIKGIAVNQDGRSANLTSPVGPAQEACISKALSRAKLSVDDIHMIETHGTGTSLGDPQEIQAIVNVFKHRNKKQDPLILGAVKSRTGHLEAAAGIIGIIKATLCLSNRLVPRNLHCQNLNPRIEKLQQKCPLLFPRADTRFQQSGILHAGVSSFGFGGANAHVILCSVESNRQIPMSIGKVSLPAVSSYKVVDLVSSSSTCKLWHVTIPPETLNCVRNHKVGAVSVVPATTYIEIINPIVEKLHPDSTYTLDDLDFSKMLFVDPDASSLILLVKLENGNRFSIQTLDEENVYATMTATFNTAMVKQGDTLDQLKAICCHPMDCGDTLYATVGNGYSGPFKRLTGAWRNDDGTVLLGKVSLDQNIAANSQPSVWLDVCSHVGISSLELIDRRKPIFAKSVGSYYSANQFTKVKEQTEVWSVVTMSEPNVLNMRIIDGENQILASVEKFSFGYFQSGASKKISFVDQWVQLDPKTGNHQTLTAFSDCKSLHRDIKKRIAQEDFEPMAVRITCPEEEGYLRCLRSEYPSWDVKSVFTTSETASIDCPGETELKIEPDGTILGRRLTQLTSLSTVYAVNVKPGGVYVVTGGLGALGLKLAVNLVHRGAEHVVLLGRSKAHTRGLPSEKMEYMSCDVSDRTQVEFALKGLKIYGVFHTAGVLQDATISNMNDDAFDAVVKVEGAQNLLNVVESPDLQVFVLYSSVSCGFGSSGQANYAAANSALDAFAIAHDTTECKFISIRWGPWGSGGMANEQNKSRFKRMGFELLEPEMALQAMFSLPIDAGPVVTICDLANDHIDPANSYLKQFATKQTVSNVVASPVFFQSEASTLATVLEIATSVSVENIDPKTSWRDAGFDSLSMVEFKNLIQVKVGKELRLHDTLLFDHPTPHLLAEWLSLKLGASKGLKTEIESSFKAIVSSSHSVVSVTGVACRLPGNSNSPEAFWDLLCSGKDVMETVPKGRFDMSNVFNPQMGLVGKAYTNMGAFINDIEYFDHDKFGISFQEASFMDPQQRLAIEVGYEALMDSHVLESKLRVGVYVGMMTNDWIAMSQQLGASTAFSASGHANSIVANRISYALGLNGPSMAIDTACSSSLVATDIALAALARGDCDVALVLGVNVILSPDLYVEECAARMLSPHGKCFTFSKKADGYARGEGCVAMVLQTGEHPHSWGAILGSAVNQDGRSANLTSPNGTAQQDVIHRALSRASVKPIDIDYVETHGTGTSLGDPLEIAALSSVFDEPGRTKTLALGAVKNCLGHGEGVAGITGILKVLLCLKHGFVPGNVSLETAEDINPKVLDVKTDFMKIANRFERMPLTEKAICGVSGFGFGGTNAHIILQRAAFQKNDNQMQEVIRWRRQLVPWNDKQKKLKKVLNSTSLIRRSETSRSEWWSLAADSNNIGNAWVASVSQKGLDFIRNHKVGNVSLVPASLYTEVVGTLLETLESTIFMIFEMKLSSMFYIEPQAQQLEFLLTFKESEQLIKITSLDEITEYAVMIGSLSESVAFGEDYSKHLEYSIKTCVQPLPCGPALYSNLGNKYAGEFKQLQEAFSNSDGSVLLGKIPVQSKGNDMASVAWFDTGFHLFLASLDEDMRRKPAFASSIAVVESLAVSRKQHISSVTVVIHVIEKNKKFDMYVYNQDSEVIMRVEGGVLGVLANVNRNAENASDIAEKTISKRNSSVSEVVFRIAKRVVSAEFTASTPWKDAGFDSLSMVEFRNQLQIELGDGLSLHETILFDYPTANELIAWVDSSMQDSPPEATVESVQLKEYEPESFQAAGDIAVVDVACRLPGNVGSPQTFWELLNSGKDAFSQIPLGRFDFEPFFDADTSKTGTMYTNSGAFLSGVDLFDNAKFGITDAETKSIDPQQRLAIELTSEILERSALKTTNVGVYVGVMTNDWVDVVRGTRARPSAFSAAGHSTSIIANRVSYVLGLNGPSLTINTACSSSLVALDAAVSALQRGDCDAAVVIGVNLILSADVYVEECASRMLSVDGKCFTFSSKANGYARGEGCVAMLLQRFQDIGKPSWGVVKGTAVNQDGKSANLTSPSGLAQQRVIEKALRRAGIKNSDIEYIESHGTATILGDSMEITALSKVFPGPQKLIVGSVKSCVGHTEGAAGLTGVLKALLCLRHGYVPKNINMEEISPKVQQVMTESMILPMTPTPLSSRTAYAGVSGFGFGGTNAHVILQGVEMEPEDMNVTHHLYRESMKELKIVYDSDDDDVSPIIRSSKKRFPWVFQNDKEITYQLEWVVCSSPLVLHNKNVFPVESVADVMKIVRQLNSARSLKITFITRSCMMGISNPSKTVTAAVWGFVRSLRQERSKWNVHLVDIDDNFNIDNGVYLPESELDTVIRKQVLVPRMKKMEHVMPMTLKFCLPVKPDYYIIVSGASGGIAKNLVEFLRLSVGHSKFICLSRSYSDSFDDVNDVTLKCDVGNELEMQQTAEKIRLAGLIVGGVIHCAGMLVESPITSFNQSQFEQHMRVKVGGAANLSDSFPDAEMFVTFSSTSSLFGMGSGSNYAASNSAIDAFAAFRNGRGKATFNIQWDIWSETGMAHDRNVTLQERGISTQKGCQAFCGIVANGITTPVVVMQVNIHSLHKTLGTSLLHDLADELLEEPVEVSRAPAVKRREVSSTVSTEPVAVLLQSCGITSMTETFANQGVDSLRAIEIVNSVEDKFGITVAPTFYMDFPTGELLANHILGLSSLEVPTFQETSTNSSLWIEPVSAPALRLFCFAYAGGHPSIFNAWLPYLPGNVQLCPISMPGYGNQSSRADWSSISELAGVIAKALPTNTPFVMAGACLGAMVAYEVSHQLKQKPAHFFAITCASPPKYADAIGFTFDGVLADNPFFTSEKKKSSSFSNLTAEQREKVINQLREAHFFQDNVTLERLQSNQEYFEHILGQLAGQLQLAERYTFPQHDKLTFPITSMGGSDDETIPDGWCKEWKTQTTERAEHFDIPDAGHFLIQTHPEKVCSIITNALKNNIYQ